MWFTADTHFRHANVIRYCERPFSTAQEMDEAIIGNLLFMPAGIFEWGNVGQEQQISVPVYGFKENFPEIFGGLISQVVEFRKTIFL